LLAPATRNVTIGAKGDEHDEVVHGDLDEGVGRVAVGQVRPDEDHGVQGAAARMIAPAMYWSARPAGSTPRRRS